MAHEPSAPSSSSNSLSAKVGDTVEEVAQLAENKVGMPLVAGEVDKAKDEIIEDLSAESDELKIENKYLKAKNKNTKHHGGQRSNSLEEAENLPG